ncbi:MAG: type II toxin-antitoxin system VapC family toxin [Rhodoferax sp.]|nr:type II toxin-antitoxin system VapC family toxin [Rhodoferax sp.]
MSILDTNVLSALMQSQVDSQVVAWLDAHPADDFWITSITMFEARYGLDLMPAGQRKQLLQMRFERIVQDDLQNRVLGFESSAANAAAELAAERKVVGCPVGMRGTFVAGIALARQATLATRNVRHFDDLQVPVLNPWLVT